MLPDQPRDANNLLRKVILGNIFNRFFTVPKALAHSFHVDFNCSLRGRRRLPRANISPYRQALYIKRRYLYSFAVVEQGYLYSMQV